MTIEENRLSGYSLLVRRYRVEKLLGFFRGVGEGLS